MGRRTRLGLGAGVLLLGAVTGCGGGAKPVSAPAPVQAVDLTLTSPAFQDLGDIPPKYTCSGSGTMPALSWSGVPADAGWLALVMNDPTAPGGIYHHLYVVSIPPGTRSVAEGGAVPGTAVVPWKAPCPPTGHQDTYQFTLYALPKDYRPGSLVPGAPPSYDLDGLEAHAIGKGMLTGKATGA